ncbi:MAG: hypothetical protein P1V18_02630 [Candidatus Gracilibacteria bacterium]|nr:hypothetical protein [Candidatus Gracilibacteria bacterium]
MSCLNNGFEEKSHLLNKRLVFVEVRRDDIEKKDAQKSLGQQKIEEFRGLSVKEAGERVDSIVDVSHNSILKQIDNWNAAGLRSKVEFIMGKGIITLGQLGDTQKRRLDRSLTRIAEKEAQKSAEKIFDDTNAVKAYASNAINILGYKVQACENLSSSIDDEITQLEERRKIINKANTGLRKVLNLKNRASDYLMQPFSSKNLRGRVARLEDMKKRVEEVKSEAEGRIDIKGEKNEKIQEWDQDLRALSAPYLKTAEQQEYFELILREAVFKGNRKAFLAFLHTLGVGSSSEMKAMENLIANICEGNTRGNIPWMSGEGRIRERIQDYTGSITQDDVRNYYLKEVADVVKTNQEASIKVHIDKMKECRPGQKMKIDELDYIMIRNDSDGAMFKEKGGEAIGYLDFSDAFKPVFSMEWESGSQKYTHMNLEPAKSSKSIDSLDFSVKKKEVEATKNKEVKAGQNEAEKENEFRFQDRVINTVINAQEGLKAAA